MAFHSEFLNTQDLQRLATKQRARLTRKSSPFHAVHSKQQMSRVLGMQKVRVRVSGKIFETFERTLRSKISSIFSTAECEKYFNQQSNEYVFDRNEKAFGSILTYFQSGFLKKPHGCSDRFFAHELRFYGMETEAKKCESSLPRHSPRILPANQTQRLLWKFMEYPDTSMPAKILSIISTFVILLSIVGFCVETLPSFNRRANPNEPFTRNGRVILHYVEACCVVWFTLEYVLRFIGAPYKCRFLYHPLNMVDVAAILPFYVTFLLKNSNTNISSFAVLRILRLVRVFRVFKLSRYSKGLQLFVHTIVASSRELLLLVFFMMIVLVLYSSGVYYVEANESASDDFRSIPHTFWLAMVTITTVGYGDMVPVSLGGKIIGSFLAVTGVLVIALPIPVIVNNFTKYYEIIMRPEECPPFSRGASSLDDLDESLMIVATKKRRTPDNGNSNPHPEEEARCAEDENETIVADRITAM